MKKILIIGGCGFIGFNLAKKLMLKNSLVILDNKINKDTINFCKKNKIKLLKGDICNKNSFEKIKYKFDVVYYVASKTSSSVSELKPKECFQTNLIGTINFYEWCKKYIPRKIIFTSSMSVYGEHSINSSENSTTDPVSFYGISKLAGEKILLKLDRKKTKLIILRLYNVYGPGQDFNNFKQGMLSIYLSQIYKFKKVNITGSVKRFRDFIFIDDVTEILEKFITSKLKSHIIYNIGTGKKTYVKDLLRKIFKYFNYKYKVTQIGSHSGDTWGSTANIRKIKLNMGWKPKFSIKNGLDLTIKDLKYSNDNSNTDGKRK